MNALNSVPTEFIHVQDEEFNRDFLADRERVFSHFGKVLNQRSFVNKKCLSHMEAANFYGGYAMHSIMSTSFRFWSSDGENSKDVRIWTRLVWQLAHVYPLGFMYSNFRFGNSVNEAWNPLKKSASDYDRSQRFPYQRSNRSLSGGPISQALYFKLFPDISEHLTSMQMFALLDVFSNYPNNDNPLYVALRNALRHTLFQYGYPVPYFWEMYMEHILTQSNEDMQSFRLYLENISDQQINKVTDIKHFNTRFLPQEEKPKQASTPSSFTAHLSSSEVQEQTAKPLADNESHHHSLIQQVAALTKKSIVSGNHRINCQKALMHVVEGKHCFVHPFAFKEMCQLYNDANPDRPIEKEQLIDVFVDSGSVLLIQGTLTPRTSQIPRPIHLAELHSSLVSAFIPSNMALEDNQDISLNECL